MAVIGFDPVIAVATGPLTTSPCYLALDLEFPNCSRIASQTIPGDYLWRLVVRVRQCLLQEQLGSYPVSRLGQVEVDRLPVTINGTEQVHPFPSDPYESLIHVPSGRFPLHLAVQ